MKNISFSFLSYIGRREQNQDSCIVFQFQKDGLLIAVADGMGGQNGGEIASSLAINIATETIKEKSAQKTVSAKDLKQIVGDIFDRVQEGVIKRTQEDESLYEMGTTLSLALIIGNKIVWGNIGDSRIYLINEKNISLLTKDHTELQKYIDQHGENVPASIVNTYGHVLSKAISNEYNEPDIFPLQSDYMSIRKGSIIMICSDGLILHKEKQFEPEFRNYLLGTKDLKEASKNLISWAYHKGASDNITLVLAEYGNIKRKEQTPYNWEYPPQDGMSTKFLEKGSAKRKNTRLKTKIGGVFLFVLLVLIVAVGIIFYPGSEKNEAEDIDHISASNKKQISEDSHSEDQKISFSGFEMKHKEVYINQLKNTSIIWERYDGKDLDGYSILVYPNGGDSTLFPIGKKRNSSTLDMLKLKKGKYMLKVFLRKRDGSLIEGKQNLILNVK